MLIPCDRHTPADLATWRRLEAQDALHWRAHRRRLERMADTARRDVERFAVGGPCYVGYSCGKDSRVLVDVLDGLGLPVVYVEVLPHANPFNGPVLADLAARGIVVDTVTVQCERAPDGSWLGTGRLEAGFALAAERFGNRYVSGVRADESYARQMRLVGHGISTERTCAPLSRWTGADVFAYLHGHGLPVHPAYAMSLGGRFPREHLRVATIGGVRGAQYGRREHEMVYYRPELEALGLDTRQL